MPWILILESVTPPPLSVSELIYKTVIRKPFTKIIKILLIQGLVPHVRVNSIGKAEPGEARVQGQPGFGGLVPRWWHCLVRFRECSLAGGRSLEEAFGSKSLTDL